MFQNTQPETISEARANPEEYLVVHVGDSYSNKTISNDTLRTKNSELWFFQVSDAAELLYAPYKLRGSDGSLVGDISSGSGSNYQRLYDSDGEDILRVEDRNWRVYHYALGVQQDDIRIYPRIPDNQNGGAWEWLTASQPDPTNGDPYGYIPGERSDYYDPSVSLEGISWETASVTPIEYGFYNEGNTAIEPILSVRGHGYELRPVEQKVEMLRILSELSKPVYNRQVSVTMIDYSRNALRPFTFDPPEAWKDAGNNLQVSRVNLPENLDKAIEGLKDKGEEAVDEFLDEVK